jgi:hypothetical protein
MMMPTYWTGEQIMCGDWVRVFVQSYGGVLHHGIIRRVVRVRNGFTVEVIHNMKDGGVASSDWSEFAGEGVVHLERRPTSLEHAQQVVARAEANIGKPYMLFAQNCEHLASFAFNGEAESGTLQTVGWMAAGFLAVAVLTSESR